MEKFKRERPKKILLIEKEKGVNRVIEDSLKLYGFNVKSFRDGHKALPLLKRDEI